MEQAALAIQWLVVRLVVRPIKGWWIVIASIAKYVAFDSADMLLPCWCVGTGGEASWRLSMVHLNGDERNDSLG
jgi:hypothetical protein